MDEENYEYDLDQELLDFHIKCNLKHSPIYPRQNTFDKRVIE